MRHYIYFFILWCSPGLFVLFSTAQLAAQKKADLPGTIYLDARLLQSNKNKLKAGDPELKSSLQYLVAAADKALTKGPYSVVNKDKIPPGGDKHDYMSIGPYWWPDPAKPDGLPYIRRDGEVNPERQAIKDVDYLKNLNADVSVLGLAYYLTGEEKYARHAADLLRVWFLNKETRMNPNLNYGQAIPGKTEGRGIGIIDTKGLVNLIDGVQLLKGSPAWKPADHRALQTWFRAYTDWLLNSPLGKNEAKEHINHEVYYDLQAGTYALFTGNRELTETLLQKQSLARLESQIEADGSLPFELARTRSWHYAIFNLKAFFGLALLGEKAGVDLWHYKTSKNSGIKAAYTWLSPFAAGDKPWQHKLLEPVKHQEFYPLARLAAVKYEDLNQETLMNHLKDNQLEHHIALLANGLLY